MTSNWNMMLSLLLSVTTCLTFLDQGLSFIPSATLNQYHSQRHARTICSMSLFDRIRSAIVRQQPDSDIGRITECWDRFATGVGVERYLDPPHNLVLQTADCFVQGLSAMPFHETEDFPWAVSLQEHSVEIWKELSDYNAKADAMKSRFAPTESEWLPPRDSAGTAYGPEWKTLGLQDRSVWDEERILDFPVTVKLLKQFNVPSCEAFFAKQGPKSGIKPHSDKNNFIITCHLALDVPEGECWIQVGDTKYHWKNGKAVIFDTSIMHSTENSSDRERYVLLIRFWHPELTPAEQKAFKFIFELLDYAALGDEALDQFEFESMQPSMNAFMGKDNHKGLSTSVPVVTKTKIKEGSSKITKENETKRSKKSSSSKPSGGGFGSPPK